MFEGNRFVETTRYEHKRLCFNVDFLKKVLEDTVSEARYIPKTGIIYGFEDVSVSELHFKTDILLISNEPHRFLVAKIAKAAREGSKNSLRVFEEDVTYRILQPEFHKVNFKQLSIVYIEELTDKGWSEVRVLDGKEGHTFYINKSYDEFVKQLGGDVWR